MRREEIKALGELAGDAAGGLASQIQQMHSGIAQRVWRAVGPGANAGEADPRRGRNPRVFGRPRPDCARWSRAGARAVSGAQPAEAESLERTVAGRAVVGAINGLWGDTLVRRRNGLALKTTLRSAGREVEPARPALARAYPHATPRLAVFVHGLCETDDAWMLGGERHVPYGFRLQAELGYTPLYVRYNTGLHISENGRELAGLLDADRRGVAGPGPRDHADRALDRWPRRPQRVPLRRGRGLDGERAPRVHARGAASRRPARAGDQCGQRGIGETS